MVPPWNAGAASKVLVSAQETEAGGGEAKKNGGIREDTGEHCCLPPTRAGPDAVECRSTGGTL